jgi:phosphatidylserine decarboxylase
MIVTILLILVCIWRAHRYGSVMGDPPLSEFSISALKWFPTREGSRLWGWLTNLEVPISLRKPIYGLYSRIFGVNLDEAEYPMEAYASLARFFTRNLKRGSRWIDPEADMISPVDGKILHFGVMKENGTIEQVKGIDYTLEQLIGKDAVEQLVDMRSKAYSDPQLTSLRNEDLERASFGANGGAPEVKTSWSEIFMNWLPFLGTDFTPASRFVQAPDQNLFFALPDFSRQKINTAPVAYNTYYCVIYLAPGDYHAFHSPVDWKCIKMRHFPGDLFSVSPIAARWIKGLFALNERIVLSGYWRHGFMSYIPVGAYNVGSITLEFDEEINTNQRGDNYAFRERTL